MSRTARADEDIAIVHGGFPMQAESVVARLQGVRKRYGGTQALDGLDLSLRAGKVTSLLGANGAGKSTAVNLLLGLLAPDQGVAEGFGQAPGSRAARPGAGAMLRAE